MRSTHTKSTDYDKMLVFASSYVGRPAICAIDDFAAKRRIVSHRAGKVFWNLVDDGKITCERRNDGIEIIREAK